VQGGTEALKPLTAAIDFLEPLNSDPTCSCPLVVKSHQRAGRWGIEVHVLPSFLAAKTKNCSASERR